MDLNFLPKNYYDIINKINIDKLYEIRLRINNPIKVNYDCSYYYLSSNGITIFKEEALMCYNETINEIINNVCEFSLYAFNDKIKNGYITTKDGIRIGISGEVVYENGKIITLKNFQSLNIRVPHNIHGCANEIYNMLFNKEIYNALIISPPFYGKTTLLKDLIRCFNDKQLYQILVIDERGEFYDVKGENIDFIRFSDKYYAFECGIRSLSPKIVITDELSSINDWQCAKKAAQSGINIIASSHGKNIEDVLYSSNFIKNVFDRYVVLDDKGKPGVLKAVFNDKLEKL